MTRLFAGGGGVGCAQCQVDLDFDGETGRLPHYRNLMIDFLI
jgi:hypothetical protein